MTSIPAPSGTRLMRYRHLAHDHMKCAQDYRAYGWLALADEEAHLSVRYTDLAFREENRLRDEQEKDHGATPRSLPEAGDEGTQRAPESAADPASVRGTRTPAGGWKEPPFLDWGPHKPPHTRYKTYRRTKLPRTTGVPEVPGT